MATIRPVLTAAAITVWCLSLTGAATQNNPSGKESDSLYYPFSSGAEVEEFLRTAEIIRDRGTPSGVTLPSRLTLSDGKVQNDAVFKTIDVRKRGLTNLEGSFEFDFKDSWKFEVAAYEIDKLLSLNMVPVTVERRYKNHDGSLQYWIQGISEGERTEKGIEPPNPVQRLWQFQKMLIFDKLIYNIDRNLTNLLVTSDWQYVLIDHSRCFKDVGEVRDIEELKYFSRSLVKSLEELEFDTLKEACGRWLTDQEIRNTLKRRDAIFEYYRKLSEENRFGIMFP